MFEEIKEFDKINVEFLKQYSPSFRDLLNLYCFHFLDSTVLKDYFSVLLTKLNTEEDLIIEILISEDEKIIKEYLEKLAFNEKEHVSLANSTIWLILKWLDETLKLPVGFDLVELCNDLVVHFNFPQIEKDMLYMSLADWESLEKNLKVYLCYYKIGET